MKQIALTLVFLCVAAMAQAEKRYALIIGNDNYDVVINLQKARADAEAVAETLSNQGVKVSLVLDGNRRAMNQAISRFTGQLRPGDTAMVFYAGHGVEIDGENFLLPTDIVAPQSGARDFIKSESIALSQMLDRVRATGARTTLAIIDACRENPFAATNGRSIGNARGLGRLTAPEGTFVIFSAGAGQLALDRLDDADGERNSVFTRLLLPRLQEPGLELRSMMADLRNDVRDLARTVGHDQFPAYYDELLGQFYFMPAAATTTSARLVSPGAEARAQAEAALRADFELARALNTVAGYDAFLEKYGDQTEAFPVTMAVLLRKEAEAGRRPAPKPSAPAQTSQTPNVPRQTSEPLDRRAIIRASQSQLNALGCKAGVADGIAGRRTQSAFANFVASTGLAFEPSDLGSQEVLDALNRRSGTICTAVAAAAPAPTTTAPSTSQGTSTTPAPATPTYSLAGTWVWTANCPVVGKVTGTSTYTSQGGGKFTGSLKDSLGQTARLSATLSGRSISESQNFGWTRIRTNATIASSGRSLSGTASQGCTFTSRKQ